MSDCVLCSREAKVVMEGSVVEPDSNDVFMADLCMDHFNILNDTGKKWCPNCTDSEPVEMEFDSFAGHEEYWYCMRCDTEYKYPSRK